MHAIGVSYLAHLQVSAPRRSQSGGGTKATASNPTTQCVLSSEGPRKQEHRSPAEPVQTPPPAPTGWRPGPVVSPETSALAYCSWTFLSEVVWECSHKKYITHLAPVSARSNYPFPSFSFYSSLEGPPFTRWSSPHIRMLTGSALPAC